MLAKNPTVSVARRPGIDFWGVNWVVFVKLLSKLVYMDLLNKTYRFEVLFCVSMYSIHKRELVSMTGRDIPVRMYDLVNNWLNTFRDLDSGVYRIEATFRNFKFWGKPIKLL